ncbi:MAG: hypothetical protein ACE5IJ_02535 [Thermoplasmata archaeon]
MNRDAYVSYTGLEGDLRGVTVVLEREATGELRAASVRVNLSVSNSAKVTEAVILNFALAQMNLNNHTMEYPTPRAHWLTVRVMPQDTLEVELTFNLTYVGDLEVFNEALRTDRWLWDLGVTAFLEFNHFRAHTRIEGNPSGVRVLEAESGVLDI